MKPKKTKEKRYFGLRLHPGWSIKKSTRLGSKLVRATGVPEVYSETVAWFAERLILAGIVIAAASFASGVLFTVYLSPPIADSEAYTYLANKMQVAKGQIIDLASPLFSKLVEDNYEPKVEMSAIEKRTQQIKDYLLSKHSPFASDDEALTALAEAKNMKLILAISFVESNFGKHCYYHNCSGIGGSMPNLKKYESYADWIKDFDNLLEARYKGMDLEKLIGLYVQPGSPNWIYGVRQILDEFNKQGIG